MNKKEEYIIRILIVTILLFGIYLLYFNKEHKEEINSIKTKYQNELTNLRNSVNCNKDNTNSNVLSTNNNDDNSDSSLIK